MLNRKQKYNVAIVGATGIVGESLLDILNSRNFPISNIVAVASDKSKGNKVKFGKQLLVVESINDFNFKQTDVAFFSAGSTVSKEFVPRAVDAGCIVIDNTSEFRYVNDIPLIIPEVNLDELVNYKNRNIIANPNCSTIQMLVALKPIHDRYSIKHINVSTYQAVSGSGKEGINELIDQTNSYFKQKDIKPKIYPKQIAFNTIPFVDSFCDNNYTKEEMKMVWETQKILDATISVNPTAVRVPVLVGHSESVSVETEKNIDINEVIQDFENHDSIQLIDDKEASAFPTAFSEGHGTDDVFVGRIRKGLDNDKVLNLWVVADNVRKGAALNSVQIAEKLIESL
ncbi:MAG: aspartate-semialdehyde dehydrogenase [Pseudomonadota bacterium]|nr:aspartate-semialdehyde dehydrogenase [Pseudomonadota bacterium]